MKFLLSVIKISSLLNFIFAITADGKHIKQLLNARQRHHCVTITQLHAGWGAQLGSLLSVGNPGGGDLFQRN